MEKRLIALSAVISLSAMTFQAVAQDDFHSRFENFTLSAVSDYTGFRDKCNSEYAEFLKKAWTEYTTLPEIVQPVEKPVPPVIYNDRGKPVKDNEIPFGKVVPTPQTEPAPSPVEPVKPVPVVKENWQYFNYIGTPFRVRVDKSMKFKLKSSDETAVSRVWSSFKGKYFTNALSDCLALRSRYGLCDWAYLNAVYAFSEAFLGNGNEAVLLSAYILSASGYKIKLGRSGDDIRLLYGSDYTIYGKNYFSISGTHYYILGDYKDENLRIADNFSFPGEKGLRLAMDKEPALARAESSPRSISAKKYNISSTCSVNRNLMDFFSGYPSCEYGGNFMTRWAICADTPMDDRVKEELYPPLRKAIEGLSRTDAASMLLNLVQTGFEYAADDEIWGCDRAFYAEETLYYPCCDCEDRSILFSRLVRDLLALDVVLVHYPGHLATAVRLDDNVEGDYLMLDGVRYTICDPTFINAPVGKSMTGMFKSRATVILLRNGE